MLKLKFWVEIAPQLSGYQVSIKKETATGMKREVQSLQCSGYDGYGIYPFSYELEKDGKIICEGTYKIIIEKLNSME